MVVLTGLRPGQIDSDPPARWWRGNLHTNTLRSDSDDFPEMVAEWYRNHGFHFLALSDQNVLSASGRWTSVKSVNRKAGLDAVAKYRKRFGDNWVELRAGGDEVRLKTFDEYRALVEERNKFLMIQSEEITGSASDGA